MMRIIRCDGVLRIRGSSGETKPVAGTAVRAYDPLLNMAVDATVAPGDTYLETDTSDVYILDTDWRLF